MLLITTLQNGKTLSDPFPSDFGTEILPVQSISAGQTMVVINGQPINLKGVNIHETNPVTVTTYLKN